MFQWYTRRGIPVVCVQNDNDFEVTNRFSNSKWDLPTLFESTAAKMGIRHKLIRSYKLRHNGKVEPRYNEGQKSFYTGHSFYPLDYFSKKSSVHNRRSNNFPMRPFVGFLTLSLLPNMLGKPTQKLLIKCDCDCCKVKQ